MKCPNCRSEVGNQPVCPYCGATVYLQSAPGCVGQAYYRKNYAPAEDRPYRRRGVELKDVDRRLRNLETKVSLCLAILCGTFALTILGIVILAFK